MASLLSATVVLAACGDDGPAHQLVGYRPSGVQQVDTVTMDDASDGGSQFAFEAQPGNLLVVYFGYTSCPDVCPTSLSMFKNALSQMGDDASRIELAMATIDPARDSSEVISNYVQSFVPTAHGLRTDDDAVLRKVTDTFGVTFMVTTGDDGNVEVSHSGAMYVVDETGKLVLTWPFGVTADDVAADLESLLGEVGQGASA
ncbi:MAG: SCO family protein [Acidimicrobiales bacterium]